MSAIEKLLPSPQAAAQRRQYPGRINNRISKEADGNHANAEKIAATQLALPEKPAACGRRQQPGLLPARRQHRHHRVSVIIALTAEIIRRGIVAAAYPARRRALLSRRHARSIIAIATHRLAIALGLMRDSHFAWRP